MGPSDNNQRNDDTLHDVEHQVVDQKEIETGLDWSIKEVENEQNKN